jgi:hypothetical protein
VLRRPRPREALLEALAGVERLVLLGDMLELRHGPVRDALEDATPVLSEIGAALGSERQVVIVPGNHDHHLAAAWLERRARQNQPSALGLESAVDWRGGEALAAVAAALAPASVEAAYPGVWLRDDIYATHGHYGDRHTSVPMFERLGAGAMAKIIREPAQGPRRPEDYEATLAPMYAWLHAIAQAGGPKLGESSHGPSVRAWRALTDRGGRSLRRRGITLGFVGVVATLNQVGMGPLRADLSGTELRRAGLAAFGEVLVRLGAKAPHVIFGHTHRAGPLPRDDRHEWLAPTGAALLNTGGWVHEPQFLGTAPQHSPYRAGFAALIADEGPPELTNLLDELKTPGRG